VSGEADGCGLPVETCLSGRSALLHAPDETVRHRISSPKFYRFLFFSPFGAFEYSFPAVPIHYPKLALATENPQTPYLPEPLCLANIPIDPPEITSRGPSIFQHPQVCERSGKGSRIPTFSDRGNQFDFRLLRQLFLEFLKFFDRDRSSLL